MNNDDFFKNNDDFLKNREDFLKRKKELEEENKGLNVLIKMLAFTGKPRFVLMDIGNEVMDKIQNMIFDEKVDNEKFINILKQFKKILEDFEKDGNQI